ncbi:hypothetical protein G1H11_15725 [Phytoactinopolyspora alkaliphila]|uniref:Uncharacterized protein n=1 Tax=Phytoactinopolyspora alkaliphila TaxID=1783498 RepID=A0A6N9YPI6_9ACTN|nr:hypothetical protein [Phytoactinopolyspora alkaliphila]NED96758.1 hypothetical protein [Phytoactinopolyspora alkaliphila]
MQQTHTLPGLLIGEWVRRKAAGPVIYATPTKQLARQVAGRPSASSGCAPDR